VATVAGWRVSARRSTAALTLADCTPLAKVQLRAPESGAAAERVGVPHLAAARDEHGVLVVGTAPGEWLALAPPGTSREVAARYQAALHATGAFATVMDLTHGRAVVRLTGEAAAATLAKVCAVDLSDAVTPDGAALRSTVARLPTDVVHDDRGGPPSYLLHCETASGQYLFDSLADAGEELGLDIEGFAPPGI
jgi:heterotetrameric sarcosine oxidase gamma subunit